MQLQKKRQICLEPNRYPTFFIAPVLFLFMCMSDFSLFATFFLLTINFMRVTALKTNWRAQYVRLSIHHKTARYMDQYLCAKNAF